MTHLEREAQIAELGYDPEYYLHESCDIRKYFNVINAEAISNLEHDLRILESLRENEEE